MQTTRTLSARHNGMTLIEVMIVVVIITIIASFAYPSYLRQAQKAGRSDATTALLAIAAAQEKEYLKNNAFTNELTVLGITETDANKYTLSVESAEDATDIFLATAHAGGTGSQSQVGDVKCQYFTIDQTGAKRAGSAVDPTDDINNCW